MSEEERNIEIINNLKKYFQNNIDNGYSKFVYNDDFADEKNIDILNALDYFLENNTKQQEEIEQLKKITNSYDSFIGNMSNKDTTIIIADKEYFDNGYFIEKYISKDKIIEKIKELEKTCKKCQIKKMINCEKNCTIGGTIIVLKELEEVKND